MAENKPYVYQEFPKWKYHPTLPGKIVQNAEEEKALGKGWYNAPNEAAKAKEGSKAIKVLREDGKPWWEEWKWIVLALAAIIGLLGGIKALLR
ncbi:MAG: hypothetical protein ACRD3P_16030 [Terriglobales bacterium]